MSIMFTDKDGVVTPEAVTWMALYSVRYEERHNGFALFRLGTSFHPAAGPGFYFNRGRTFEQVTRLAIDWLDL